MLIIGGLFSIPVYLVILLRSKKRNIPIQLSKKVNFQKKTPFLPYLLFALLSTTITIMIFVTQLFS
jgi:preprotein translocase subunit SecY